MTSEERLPEPGYGRYDVTTLVAISALAYIVAIGLHEHLGHAAACLALGSQVKEFGAFYIECDDARLSGGAVRLVALAGPLVSLVIGIVAFKLMGRLPRQAHIAQYFVWLLGAVALLDATGYPLFSGISGIGDLGGTSDGVFYGVEPEWLWRSVIALIGGGCYLLVAMIAVRKLEDHIPGAGRSRKGYARGLLLISYLSGGAISIIIGAFNPHGWSIVVGSALAGTFGGTSGLLWMPSTMSMTRAAHGNGLGFARDWRWIAVSIVILVTYGAVFGPTLFA